MKISEGLAIESYRKAILKRDRALSKVTEKPEAIKRFDAQTAALTATSKVKKAESWNGWLLKTFHGKPAIQLKKEASWEFVRALRGMVDFDGEGREMVVRPTAPKLTLQEKMSLTSLTTGALRIGKKRGPKPLGKVEVTSSHTIQTDKPVVVKA